MSVFRRSTILKSQIGRTFRPKLKLDNWASLCDCCVCFQCFVTSTTVKLYETRIKHVQWTRDHIFNGVLVMCPTILMDRFPRFVICKFRIILWLYCKKNWSRTGSLYSINIIPHLLRGGVASIIFRQEETIFHNIFTYLLLCVLYTRQVHEYTTIHSVQSGSTPKFSTKSLECSFLFTHESLTNHSQITQESLTNHPRFTHKSLTNHQRITHESFTNHSRIIHDSFTNHPRTTLGVVHIL